MSEVNQTWNKGGKSFRGPGTGREDELSSGKCVDVVNRGIKEYG